MPILKSTNQAIIKHISETIQDQEAIYLYCRKSKQRVELKTQLRAVKQFDFLQNHQEACFWWEYGDETEGVFWRGVRDQLVQFNQTEKAEEWLNGVTDWEVLRKQTHCRDAMKEMFGQKKPPKRKPYVKRSNAEKGPFWSKSFTSGKYDQQGYSDHYATILRNIIVGNGDGQLGYSTDQYKSVESAFIEHAVITFIDNMTNGKAVVFSKEIDSAKKYIETYIRNLEDRKKEDKVA